MISEYIYNNILFQNEFGLSEDQVAGKFVCKFIYSVSNIII